MKKTFKYSVRIFGLATALVGVLMMAGCGIPGFGNVASMQTNQGLPNSRNHFLGYQPVIETAPVDGTGDAPEGAISSISLALIKEQLQSSKLQTIPADVQALFGIAPGYTIGPGDVIGIIVYDHPELLPSAGAVITQQIDPTGISVAPGFIVGATGEISFPYIGRLKLQGLTEIDASDLVARRISAYIKDPQVTVRIQSFRSKRAYVEGEVRTPGLQIFTDVPMTLAEAINRAGGITSSGDRSFITLTRSDKTTVLNLPALQDMGVDASRIPLLNGDVVNVRNRDESKVYVMGEILRPSALLMRNGKLSLNEAIGESGGPNLQTANAGQIYVIRNELEGKPKIYNLDAKNPAALALADRFPLKPRDVVYIDPVPLVQWNRVISLIVPSAQVLDLGSSAITR